MGKHPHTPFPSRFRRREEGPAIVGRTFDHGGTVRDVDLHLVDLRGLEAVRLEPSGRLARLAGCVNDEVSRQFPYPRAAFSHRHSSDGLARIVQLVAEKLGTLPDFASIETGYPATEDLLDERTSSTVRGPAFGAVGEIVALS